MIGVKRILYKWAWSAVVFVGSLATLAANAAAQSPSLSVSGATGVPGATVTLDVSLNPGGTLPASVQWDLTYSTSDLSLVTGTYDAIGTAGSGAGKSVDCNSISAGDVRCIVSGININAIGSGVLATLTFTIAPGTTDTSTTVSLVSPEASDESANALAVTGGGATVTINHIAVGAVSVTPSSGSGASQSFALQYSDSAGAGSLAWVWAWFSASIGSAAHSCVLYYQPSTNQVNLLNDAGSAWTGATPGATATLQNSQCSLNLATSSVTQNGNTLTLNLAMTFKPAFSGAQNVYLYASDVSGPNTGWEKRGTWTTSGVPSAVSASPNSGSTASETFALEYSDTAGASILQSLWVWFNASLTDSPNSCEMYYQPSTNQMGLLNDAGSAWTAGTVGAATTLQNSQCSLNLATTSVTPSGNTMTLNPAITFTSAYAGAKNIYMYAADVSGSNTGWLQRGSWTVPDAVGTPAAVSVTPSSGSTASQSFALQYSDTAGASNLQSVLVWFNPMIGSSGNSCELYYQPSTNQVGLLNDASTAWTTATVGSATTLQNSQCSLNLAAASVAQSGNTMTVNLTITFTSAYAGAKNIYMYAADISGANTGWLQRGSWTVPGADGTPAAVSVTPNSGSGASQTFTLQYSDTGGTGSLAWVWAWFDGSIGSGANSCLLYYQPSINQVNLLNDAGTAWAAATPGAAATLQNSQCSLNLAATSVTQSGDTLTLNLALTFKPGFSGAQNVYMYAGDVSGSNTGWIQRGAWTAQ